MTPETLQRIAVLRQKSIDGTITIDELREGVTILRGDRKAASTASDASRRAKAKAAIPSADDMLNELGNI